MPTTTKNNQNEFFSKIALRFNAHCEQWLLKMILKLKFKLQFIQFFIKFLEVVLQCLIYPLILSPVLEMYFLLYFVMSMQFLIVDYRIFRNMATQTAYVEVSLDNLIPKNIIPANTVKCMHCSLQVPVQLFGVHLQSHIPQKYLHAVIKQKIGRKNRTGKVDIRSIFQEDDYDLSDLSVKSFLPQQMPQPQTLRKQAAPIQQNIICNEQSLNSVKDNIQNLYTNTNSQTKQLPDTLQLKQLEASIRQPEPAEAHLQIKQDIVLGQLKTRIQHKKIHYYTQQQKNHTKWEDKIVHPAKAKIQCESQQIEEGKQNINVYVVQPIASIKKKHDKNQPITIQVRGGKKQPKYKQKISTISTSASGEGFYRPSLNIKIHQRSSNEIEQITNTNPPQKFECSQCKGFYCKACGSDIPPIYRPVQQNDSSFQINQQIKTFYNTNLQTKSFCKQSRIKSSRLTGCTNCQ